MTGRYVAVGPDPKDRYVPGCYSTFARQGYRGHILGPAPDAAKLWGRPTVWECRHWHEGMSAARACAMSEYEKGSDR